MSGSPAATGSALSAFVMDSTTSLNISVVSVTIAELSESSVASAVLEIVPGSVSAFTITSMV